MFLALTTVCMQARLVKFIQSSSFRINFATFCWSGVIACNILRNTCSLRRVPFKINWISKNQTSKLIISFSKCLQLCELYPKSLSKFFFFCLSYTMRCLQRVCRAPFVWLTCSSLSLRVEAKGLLGTHRMHLTVFFRFPSRKNRIHQSTLHTA